MDKKLRLIIGKATKKSKPFILWFFFLCCSSASFSQVDTLQNLVFGKKIHGRISDFTTDNLGNIYIITENNQLKKYNPHGDSVSVYNDVRRFGKITAVDAGNPLKILVYFSDFGRLVILDRLLNIRNTIDLRQQQILQVGAFAPSYDNNIWLYDELESTLKKIDDSGNVLMRTSDFRQIFETAPLPVYIADRDGLVYLYDPMQGIAVFDYYGGLKNNLQLKNISDLQVIDKNTITGRDSANLVVYKPSLLKLNSYSLPLPVASYKKIRFDGLKLYTLNQQGELEIIEVK